MSSIEHVGRFCSVLLLALLVPSIGAKADVPGLGAYSYDGSGNITAVGSQTYRYDAFGRVTKATLSAQNEQTYTYDRYGNVLTIGTKLNGVTLQSQQPAVNPCTNRIQLESLPAPGCANPSTYNLVGTYDAAGNVLSLEGNSFEYDVLNTTTASTVAGVRRVHLYSASGERVASVTMSGGAPLRWDWTLRDTSNRVLRRLSFQGNIWRWEEDYLYAGGKLIAAAVPTPEKILHFHADHLGTPRLITGNGGARVSEFNYFPFGREVPPTTQQATAVPPFNEALKFTGHERDAGTLDYMHARYYASYLGRFLAVDPTWESADLGKPQSWNRYSYVRNQPITLTDPDGRNALVPPVVVALGAGAYVCASSPVCAQRVLAVSVVVIGLMKDMEDATPGIDSAPEQTDTAATTEGIYEFPDAKNPGATYVGQSGNIPQRMEQHEESGKKDPNEAPKTTEVKGGKTAREHAEQNRINELGGKAGTPGSQTSNKVNPIGPKRQPTVEELYGPIKPPRPKVIPEQ